MWSLGWRRRDQATSSKARDAMELAKALWFADEVRCSCSSGQVCAICRGRWKTIRLFGAGYGCRSCIVEKLLNMGEMRGEGGMTHGCIVHLVGGSANNI